MHKCTDIYRAGLDASMALTRPGEPLHFLRKRSTQAQIADFSRLDPVNPQVGAPTGTVHDGSGQVYPLEDETWPPNPGARGSVPRRFTPPKKRQKELKNFQRVTLEPGETKRVEFQMSPEDLAFTGLDEKPVIEPGEYHVSAL